MYCPKCSQQQLTDEVRFCSRCGFQLVVVSHLLRTEGVSAVQVKDRLPLIKRPEVRKSIKRVSISFCLFILSFPVMGLIDPHFPFASPFIIGIGFFTFLFSLIQMFYYVFFGENIPAINVQNQYFAVSGNPSQLNYQSVQRLLFETRSFDTVEFIQPPSITESTAELTKNK